MTKKIKDEKLHTIPADLKKVLTFELQKVWKTLTPLSKNEWICWVTMAKKTETRNLRLERLNAELLEGKKRPCCWPGCPHRRPGVAKWFSKNKNEK